MTRILIIEDELLVRENLVEMLSAEGFDAIAAENGRVGIETAQRELPDLIICDIMMPDGDGYEVLNAVRQNFKTATIPFIFLTAQASQQDFRRGMEIGADDYLAKPFTRRELLKAIETQLKKQGLRQNFYNDRLLRAQEKLNYSIYYDPLTQLPNRLSLREQFDRVLRGVAIERDSGQITIMCLSLDRLERVNAVLGYDAGDRLLQLAAQRLSEVIGKEGRVAYLSDNRFTIILTALSTEAETVKRVRDILDRLKQPYRLNQREVFLSASIGITFYPSQGNVLEILLAQADLAMDRAKKRGGDRYQLYSPDLTARMSESVEIETDLRRALERNEFQVYYQPRVSLQTGKIVGAEALIRWYHPEQGAISPSKFIPIAENTGLIIPIGAWVLATACRQTQIWQAQFSYPLEISVNLSVRQFSQPNLSQWIVAVLRSTQLDAKYLELELTESILVNNSTKAKQRLTEIKATGVKLAIDDFGTGYSSLNYLRQFPFDSLKIDRCFICNLAEESDFSRHQSRAIWCWLLNSH